MGSSVLILFFPLGPDPLDGSEAEGFGLVHFGCSPVAFSAPLLNFVNFVRIFPFSHLYPGLNVGIQAAAIPKKTSQDRQYQLGILAQVGSEVSFCQFRTVRTMEREPVMTPRPMRAQRPSLERKEICTLRRMRMGKAERKKSEMMDMTGWWILSVEGRMEGALGCL